MIDEPESGKDMSPGTHTISGSSDAGNKPPPAIARRFLRHLARRWGVYSLVLIVVSSTLLSLCWVFRVPILQNPDENSHIDYAFSIYSAGRLLNVRRAPSGWNVHARAGALKESTWERISHQYTLYLVDATDFQRIRFHPKEKVSPDYGTAAYYQRLDRNAPHSPANVSDLQPQDNPWLVTGYPFGYYVLVAIWLKLVSLFNGTPVVLFFGARILSALLLPGSLILTYLAARELGLRNERALALTFVVAFFPLTTFVSSSVQPDNLSFLLMLLCFYLSLLIRKRSSHYWLVSLLGTALGLLLITKYHFYLFTLACVMATFVSECIFKRISGKAMLQGVSTLLLPSVLFFCVQLWVTWGSGRSTGGTLHHSTAALTEGVKNAVVDYYGGGRPFLSWWGLFGWMDTPLIIGSMDIQRSVTLLLVTLTLAILALTLLRLEQVVTRLILLARRGRWRWAVRIAFSNPIINSHFAFTIFIILLYALTNDFYAQGRHWFPYILSSFLIATQYAPRAFTHRKAQAVFSALMVLGLAIYCAVGSYYSIQTINARYYGTRPTTNAITGETSQSGVSKDSTPVSDAQAELLAVSGQATPIFPRVSVSWKGHC